MAEQLLLYLREEGGPPGYNSLALGPGRVRSVGCLVNGAGAGPVIGKWTAREAALGTFPDKVYPRATPGRPPKISNPKKLVQKRAPKKNQFWINFGAHSGPKMDPKISPKLVQKLSILGSIFGSLFFEVLELLGCLLGAFLGLLRLSWEASRAKKCRQSNAKTTF